MFKITDPRTTKIRVVFSATSTFAVVMIILLLKLIRIIIQIWVPIILFVVTGILMDTAEDIVVSSVESVSTMILEIRVLCTVNNTPVLLMTSSTG